MRQWIKIGFLGLSILSIQACNKDKDMVRATIINTGDVTVQGCGYLFQLADGTYQRPEYLPSAYHHHGMEVMVKYEDAKSDVICAWGNRENKHYDNVKIVDIRKAND